MEKKYNSVLMFGTGETNTMSWLSLINVESFTYRSTYQCLDQYIEMIMSALSNITAHHYLYCMCVIN